MEKRFVLCVQFIYVKNTDAVAVAQQEGGIKNWKCL